MPLWDGGGGGGGGGNISMFSDFLRVREVRGTKFEGTDKADKM